MGKRMKFIDKDKADFLFRFFFSIIFLGMGMEHLFSDELIRSMMPDYILFKRLVSILSGLLLITGGGMILVGFKIRYAAIGLGAFVTLVNIVVHAPALFHTPIGLANEWTWLWEVYQRSNFVKNICLLGVCLHLLHYEVGKFSLEYYRKKL